MRRWRLPAAALAGVLAAVTGEAQVPAGTTRILVVPFERSERDHRAVWLGEASAVLIADTLRLVVVSSGTLDVHEDELERLWRDLGVFKGKDEGI